MPSRGRPACGRRSSHLPSSLRQRLLTHYSAWPFHDLPPPPDDLPSPYTMLPLVPTQHSSSTRSSAPSENPNPAHFHHVSHSSPPVPGRVSFMWPRPSATPEATARDGVPALGSAQNPPAFFRHISPSLPPPPNCCHPRRNLIFLVCSDAPRLSIAISPLRPRSTAAGGQIACHSSPYSMVDTAHANMRDKAGAHCHSPARPCSPACTTQQQCRGLSPTSSSRYKLSLTLPQK